MVARPVGGCVECGAWLCQVQLSVDGCFALLCFALLCFALLCFGVLRCFCYSASCFSHDSARSFFFLEHHNRSGRGVIDLAIVSLVASHEGVLRPPSNIDTKLTASWTRYFFFFFWFFFFFLVFFFLLTTDPVRDRETWLCHGRLHLTSSSIESTSTSTPKP